MRDEEVFIAIAVIAMTIGGTIAVVGMLQKERRARRQERQELLRNAMQHPQIDELTRAELLRTIAREQDDSPRLLGMLRTGWFAVGWMMFVIGGGMALLDAIQVVRIDAEPAAGVGLAGFAMLSLPLGLRELQRRDHTVAGQRQA